MSLFDKAADELDDRTGARPDPDPEDDEPRRVAPAATLTGERAATTTVAGETVSVERPETSQADDDGWLTGANKYGWPRGRDALEARRISQTSAMQTIANGIVDQLLGGELSFEARGDDDLDEDGPAADLQAIIRDVLEGPHLMDDDLDDLLAAAVDDMLGPGNAYWQLLPSENGQVPVVSIVPLDALTIRHNYDRHGYPQEPAYYQAPGAFSGGDSGFPSLGSIDVTELEAKQLCVMRYPKGRRSHSIYPQSPSLQVREWLELLVNSTTHHDRFYDDNQVPPGLLQVMGEHDVSDIRDKIEASKGDPRSAPIIGGEGQAMWVEMGGTSVNLNVIEEQKWFLQLCLAAVGLGKQELGFIEDVNRSNGEVESSRIFKRVTRPFAKQFERAFAKVVGRFDAYERLDQPFDVRLRFTDPREELERQERLRQQYQTGLITYNDFLEARGLNPSEVDTTVEVVEGVEIDYGDKPKPIVESVMIARRMEAMNVEEGGDGEDEQQVAAEMSAAFESPEETERGNGHE